MHRVYRNFTGTTAAVALSIGFSGVGFIGSASAADLGRAPAPVYTKAPLLPPPFTWTGFYVGGHVGGVWDDLSVTDVSGYNVPAGTSFGNNKTGAFGGGTFGYNFQTGPAVFGVESDLGYMGLGSTTIQPGSPGGDTKSRIHDGVYGDVTGRLGYGWGQSLIYAKGGWAFYDANVEVFDNCSAAPCGGALNQSNKANFMSGWTAGAGWEQALTRDWSVKAEYLHFDFGSQTVQFVAAPDVWRNNLRADSVKFGFNYRFGGFGGGW